MNGTVAGTQIMTGQVTPSSSTDDEYFLFIDACIEREQVMKPYLALLVLTVLACGDIAYGHAHLQVSEPANASTVMQPPKRIVLQFNEATQLTVLTLQKGESQPQKLEPLPGTAAKSISVPLPAIDAGAYVVSWRAIGDDGHVVSGTLSFTVAPAASGKAQ